MRAIILTSVALISSLFAQGPASPPKPTLESSLASVASALSIENGRFGGPGTPILESAISQADFVSLGEDHLTREIPRFAAAVCDAMGASGASPRWHSNPARRQPILSRRCGRDRTVAAGWRISRNVTWTVWLF